MAQGGAEFRPRAETANWALASTVGWVVLWVPTRDTSLLFAGALCGALWLQCRQRIVVDGRFVQRIGLHPVVLDLGTAEVICTGRPWWAELFFCGRSLQLRDAGGRRLYLESWLWDAETRSTFVEAVSRGSRP